MSAEIDHEYTSNPICPHCGQKESDAWELHLGDGDQVEQECDCGKSYIITCNVSVSYSTEKSEDKP